VVYILPKLKGFCYLAKQDFVMLQPATENDAAYFYELYMHPAINPYLLYDPMPEEEFFPIFNELLDKKVLYVFKAGDIAAGMCKLVPQYHRNAHMLYVGGLAVHPEHQGKGYGLQLMNDIISFADQKGIIRIELSTAVGNSAAIRLYERAGFVIEGRLRNYTWFKNENRYIDEFIMSRIA